MIDTIIILLMSLPLIVLGSTIGPDSAINFGSRISKAKLKSVEGLKRLRRIKIEKKGKGLLVLMLSIIVILGMLLLIGTLPITGSDNNTTIRNDTLFIEGSYAKEIPIASITQVDSNAMVPDIEMRTNGTSLGENNVGYFQTKEGKDVLLYLHSDDTNVTHIKTKNNEDIYINFKDSALSVDFPNKLRAIYRQPTKGK